MQKSAKGIVACMADYDYDFEARKIDELGCTCDSFEDVGINAVARVSERDKLILICCT